MKTVSHGFTIVELMVVIAIGAILVGLAVPSFRDQVAAASRREASTQLYSAFMRARSEAITNNASVRVCAMDTSTITCNGSALSSGWLVGQLTASNTISTVFQSHRPRPNVITFGAYPTALDFDSRGRASSRVAIAITSVGASGKDRCLIVERSGRINLTEASSCS